MSITPLRSFVCSMTRLVESRGNAEADALEPARDLLAALVRRDGKRRELTTAVARLR